MTRHGAAPVSEQAAEHDPFPEHDRLEAAVAARVEFWRTTAAAVAGSRLTVADGLAQLHTGLPVSTFNGVLGLRPDLEPDTVLDAVNAASRTGAPWSVQLRPGYPAILDDELAARGLVVQVDEPFMLLRTADAPTDSSAIGDLALRTAVSYADVDSVLTLYESGFGMAEQLTRSHLPVASFFLPGVTTWLVAADGHDVSTALTHVSGDVCGIFNVATRAERRRQGYAAAVTAHAVRAAAARGVRTAYLQPSPMGLALYQRLGFRVVEHWRRWVPAAQCRPR